MSNSTSIFPIRLINGINAKCCSVTGAILNIALIWLVWKRTPKEMQMYSRIILQTCFSDLVTLALAELVQPIAFVSDGGKLMVLENGPTVDVGHPLNIVVYNMWLFATFFGIAGLVVQFIYRYLVLCRGKDLGAREYYLLLVGAVAFEASGLSMLFWTGFPGERLLGDPQVLGLLGESPDNVGQQGQLRLVLFGDKTDLRWLICTAYGFTNNSICYSIIMFCGVKMVTHVKANLAKANKRATEINRQMTLNMLIQATLPVVDISTFSLLLYACLAPPSDFLICLLMSMCTVLNWVPVLNPLVTILTVAPYRRTILRCATQQTAIKSSEQRSRQTNNNNVNNIRVRSTSRGAIQPVANGTAVIG